MHGGLEVFVRLGGLDNQLQSLAFLYVHQERQFVGHAVVVEVVIQLRRNLLAFLSTRVHA